MGKLMATGVGQQIESGQFTTEIPPLQDFPAGEPAYGGLGLLLGKDHPGSIGDLMLPGAGVVTVVRSLAGADPALQRTSGATPPDPVGGWLPQKFFSDRTHQFAQANSVISGDGHREQT